MMLAAAVSAGSMAVMADEPSVTLFENQMYLGGYMPECISADGKYVSGSTFAWAGFVSEWATQNTKVYLESDGSKYEDYGCDLPFINNQGVAVGFDDNGALKIDFPNGTLERLRLGGLPDAITQDGSTIVGMYYISKESDFIDPHTIGYQACYWRDGKVNLLPVPDEKDLGFYYNGTRARCISGDGSVILGEIIDRLATYPMILWYRQDDGSYKLDPVCMEYFSDIRDNDGTYKEYVTFHGNALSDNGEWVAMNLRKAPEYGEYVKDPILLGLYNVKTGEIKNVTYAEDGSIAPFTLLSVYYNAISDNGTVVGYFNNDEGGVSAFILYADEMQPKVLSEVFPSIEEFQRYEENGTLMVSAISANGRYICGMGWDIDEQYDLGYYAGFVLDCGEDDSAHAPGDDNGDDDAVDVIEMGSAAPVYYNLQGNPVSNPDRGIFIKVEGSKAEKIVK